MISAITIAGIGNARATSGADSTAAIATAADSATPGARARRRRRRLAAPRVSGERRVGG